jgi:hypothetical protein
VKWIVAIAVALLFVALAAPVASWWCYALNSSDLAMVMSVASGIGLGIVGSRAAIVIWLILDDRGW